MKYLLTLLGVAFFVVMVFAFKGDFLDRQLLKIENRSVSIFGKGEKGNGDVMNQVRNVGLFTSVSSSNAIRVKLIKGEVPKVVVRTDSNLQEHILTEIRGSELKIYVKGSIRKYSEMTVYVTFTELDALKSASASVIMSQDKIVANKFSLWASSASSIKLDTLQADEIKVDASSAANVRVAGMCTFLEVEASSAADANLYGLESQNAKIDASSAANVEVLAVVKIYAEASSGADISYRGNPKEFNVEESSGGDVDKK